MQVGRDVPALHRQHRLNKARDPGRGLQMTQIRFDRPDQQRSALRPCAAQHPSQRPRFDGIAKQRAGAVGLDIIDVAWLDAGVGVGGAQHRHLRRRIGGHQPVGPAVLIDRRTADHRKHPITIAQRVSEPLKHRDPATLTTHKTIGARVECVTSTRRRHRLSLIEAAGNRRRQQQVHPRRDRQIRIARPQTLAGQMHRHQRRRTRRVDRYRRAPQVEEIRDPIGDNAQRTPRARPRIHLA